MLEEATMYLALILLNLCNVCDAFSTLRAVAHGNPEVNPLMASLIHLGPSWFLMVKLLTVWFSSFFLMHIETKWIWVPTVVLAATVMWHLYNIGFSQAFGMA